jgi:excinuclease UvrABC ATPase subunit
VKLHLGNTTENEIDSEKKMEKLTKRIKISSKWKFRNNRRNMTQYLKIWDDQIKQLIETEKKII